MSIQNKKGFLLVEIVIAAGLLVIFLFGIYKFFNVQNKNIDGLIKEYNGNNLTEDAVFIFSNTNYNDLYEGLYGLYFEENLDGTYNYKITPITNNNTSYEEGKYIDELGLKTSYVPEEENKNTYRIQIQVFGENEVFLGQKFKNITISLRYPGCNFQESPCITKDFTVLEKQNYE